MQIAIRGLLILIVAVAGALTAEAQVINVKNTLLSDIELRPNLGAEFKGVPEWALELSGSSNTRNVNGYKGKCRPVQTEPVIGSAMHLGIPHGCSFMFHSTQKSKNQ